LGVFKIRKWTIVPNVEILIKKYTSVPYKDVLRTNGSEMAKAVTKAEKLNDAKARYSNIVNNYAPLGIGGIVAAMGLTFIAFEGYEIIVQTGEEVKNPKKNIPRAIFISLTLLFTLWS
jgi:amino acid transporter